MRIDECHYCGTFQVIPTEDLSLLSMDDEMCEDCLKVYLDNDDHNGTIGENCDA